MNKNFSVVNIVEDKFPVNNQTGWKPTTASSLEGTSLIEKISKQTAVCIIRADEVKIFRRDQQNNLVKKIVCFGKSSTSCSEVIQLFHAKLASEFNEFIVETQPQQLKVVQEAALA